MTTYSKPSLINQIGYLIAFFVVVGVSTGYLIGSHTAAPTGVSAEIPAADLIKMYPHGYDFVGVGQKMASIADEISGFDAMPIGDDKLVRARDIDGKIGELIKEARGVDLKYLTAMRRALRAEHPTAFSG